MSARYWLALAGLVAVVAGCDHSTPTTPTLTAGEVTPVSPVSTEAARLERIARWFARALRNESFRSYVRTNLRQSRYPEHKLQFQRFLTSDNRRALQEMARENNENEGDIEAEAGGGLPLEVYLPVSEHRERWGGEDAILVATALADGEVPVAFDTEGGRHELNPNHPPVTPVIAIVPAETDFDQPPRNRATCNPATCGGGGGGGGTPVPGLYMTLSHFVGTFEGWLKGSPEFEIHVLGQSGTTDSLKSYQCAGEKSGGSYYFDQDALDWSGGVLLFSQTQLDSYRQQHPGQSIRVFAVEDDDTACQIKSGGDTFSKLLGVVDAAYNAYTGGRDSATGLIRIFRKASVLQKLWQKLAGLINTNDELIGDAVEDTVVGQFNPGANWIVKGDGNATNGWLKLEMK